MPALELTLAILKPHVIKNPHSLKSIRKLILTSNFKIVQSKRFTFDQEIAKTFYLDHKDKFFYNRLITFMTSGPSDLYILARENAIQEWRDLMGPTKTYKAQYEDPDTIRGEFGLSDTRNATHGSDSVESATREMKLLFPEFNVLKWQENEEFYFRSNSLIFCCFDFVHKVNYK
ncbi:hypothetical protein PPYR_13292 [Photinus pyralis]|uniref:Nucleoside diphosphate kinase n=1 Tax=Photinus pyralis TaxID=7054 RepID=A0A1Y1NG14_PHOPY|nr:nucleoside diphosphate kinase 6-like isoform X1 [Photinus pyralis]KAB0793672.1 hypothetical protein PPYR_13292 [Photinus pyralis]